MHQTHSPDPNARLQRVVRADYDLTPNQLRLLVAIVLFEAIEYHSPSLGDLQAMLDDQPAEYRVAKTNALAELVKQGLVEKHGTTREVRYGPTVTGVRRAMRP